MIFEDDIRADIREMLWLRGRIDYISAALMDGKKPTDEALKEYEENQISLDALKKKYGVS